MQVTLTISDELYQQAQLVAELTDRPVHDVLAESIVLPGEQAVPSHLAADKAIAQEIAAYLNMHSGLLEAFAGQYVAIYQGKLVGHAQEFASLFGRVCQQYPDEFVLIRQVENEPEPVYHFRSPRFATRV